MSEAKKSKKSINELEKIDMYMFCSVEDCKQSLVPSVLPNEDNKCGYSFILKCAACGYQKTLDESKAYIISC